MVAMIDGGYDGSSGTDGVYVAVHIISLPLHIILLHTFKALTA